MPSLKYWPRVKTLGSEIKAFGQIAPDLRTKISPIWRATPVEADKTPKKKTNRKLRTVEEKVHAVLGKATSIFPTENWIDLSFLGRFPDQAKLALSYCLAHAESCFPVVSPSENNLAYSLEWATASRQVAFRCRPSSFEVAGIATDLTRAISQLDKSTSASLILDYEDVTPVEPVLLSHLVRDAVSKLKDLADWKHVVFLGCGIKASWGDICPDNSWKSIVRKEFSAWQALNLKQVQFGDYCLRPVEESGGAGDRGITPKLLYSFQDQLLIGRAENTKKSELGYNQIFDLCDQLTRRDEFMGKDFSWGDSEIQRYADGRDNPLMTSGQSGDWLSWTMNHHATLLAKQFS